MQFQRGRHGGLQANGVTTYDAILTQCLASVAISVNQMVVWDLSPADSGDLGYAVTNVSGAADDLFVGRADHAAAALETIMVQCYGVGVCIADGNATAGVFQILSTTDGQVRDGTLGTNDAASVGVALETDAGAGDTILVALRCM